MIELIIEGVAHEMTEDRFEQLRATDAIILEDGDWVVNPYRQNFTREEVMWLLDMGETL